MVRSQASDAPSTREQNVTALMDAAERLLVRVGDAGTTTRRLATEAGLNQGLVHYYFGSMEEVLVQVLERFTGGLTAVNERCTGRCPSSRSGVRRWAIWKRLRVRLSEGLVRAAGDGLEPPRAARSDRASWPNGGALLTEAFGRASEEYGLDWRIGALVSLVVTFNLGLRAALLGNRPAIGNCWVGRRLASRWSARRPERGDG